MPKITKRDGDALALDYFLKTFLNIARMGRRLVLLLHVFSVW